MDTNQLKQAVDTARRAGMTPQEALVHWDLAGGAAAGEAAMHWAVLAVELADQSLRAPLAFPPRDQSI